MTQPKQKKNKSDTAQNIALLLAWGAVLGFLAVVLAIYKGGMDVGTATPCLMLLGSFAHYSVTGKSKNIKAENESRAIENVLERAGA